MPRVAIECNNNNNILSYNTGKANMNLTTSDLPKITIYALDTFSHFSLEGWFQVLRGDTPGISSGRKWLLLGKYWE